MTVGGMKLIGVPSMVETFGAIGMGQWLRHVTGLVEIYGGAALLMPSLAPFAAVLLASTMVGAALAHLLVLPGSPILAFVLFALCSVIAWTGRNQITACADRYLRGAMWSKKLDNRKD